MSGIVSWTDSPSKLPTTEEVLAKERKDEEVKVLRHFQDNLRSFIIAIESLLQSAAYFLTADDVLDGSPNKEFVLHIYEDDKVKWVFILRFSNEGKKYGSLFPGGVADQSFLVGYDFVVECSFQGGKLFESIIHKDTVTSLFSPIIISLRLEGMIKEYNGLEMIKNKIHLIFDLERNINHFFRQLLLDKCGAQITGYVRATAQKFYYLVNQSCHMQRRFSANQIAVHSFQGLVFETAQELKDSKSFVKSKKLAQIRENLERRSRDILAQAQVNR